VKKSPPPTLVGGAMFDQPAKEFVTAPPPPTLVGGAGLFLVCLLADHTSLPRPGSEVAW